MKDWVKVLIFGCVFWFIMTAAICYGLKPEAQAAQVEDNKTVLKLNESPKLEQLENIENGLVDLGEFTLTAYCSCFECCKEWALSRPLDSNGNVIVYGSTGQILKEGTSIAVDPTVIPYGTNVYIDGKEYIAQDCGSSIKGNRIDVYFENHLAAKSFGVKEANVEVKI